MNNIPAQQKSHLRRVGLEHSQAGRCDRRCAVACGHPRCIGSEGSEAHPLSIPGWRREKC